MTRVNKPQYKTNEPNLQLSFILSLFCVLTMRTLYGTNSLQAINPFYLPHLLLFVRSNKNNNNDINNSALQHHTQRREKKNGRVVCKPIKSHYFFSLSFPLPLKSKHMKSQKKYDNNNSKRTNFVYDVAFCVDSLAE